MTQTTNDHPSSSLSTLEEIKRRSKRRYAQVEAGGLTFRIRSITALEWRRYVLATTGEGGESISEDSNARLIQLVVVDDQDNPLFSEEDIPELMEMDRSVENPLLEEIGKHCGLRRDMEAVEKN